MLCPLGQRAFNQLYQVRSFRRDQGWERSAANPNPYRTELYQHWSEAFEELGRLTAVRGRAASYCWIRLAAGVLEHMQGRIRVERRQLVEFSDNQIGTQQTPPINTTLPMNTLSD